MNQRHRSSRIIDIALTSAGIRTSPKCKQKLNFDDEPALQPAPAPDPGDGILVEDSREEPVNYSTVTYQDYGGIVPLAPVEKNVGQPVSCIPSPSEHYTMLENSSLNAKVGKEVTAVVDTIHEPGQQGFNIYLVDRRRENLSTNFTNSDLTSIDQPSTSSGLVAELMSLDYVPLPGEKPIIDGCNNSTQPLNSMDTETPNFDTSSTNTAVIEVQSNDQSIPQKKKSNRKCKTKAKYIDYMSDQEDFSTFYGDDNDSDDWLKEQTVSDEESDDLETTEKTAKKKKRFRRRKNKTLESGDQEETVGDSGLRVKKLTKERKGLTRRKLVKSIRRRRVSQYQLRRFSRIRAKAKNVEMTVDRFQKKEEKIYLTIFGSWIQFAVEIGWFLYRKDLA